MSRRPGPATRFFSVTIFTIGLFLPLQTLTCAGFARGPEFCVVTEAEEFKSIRRLALASLGRNVLHFQRLEAQLKLLLLFCDFQSPIAQFAANHKRKAESVRMKTMGAVLN
jgi:hypothetical protein